jgi:hypothetical protein
MFRSAQLPRQGIPLDGVHAGPRHLLGDGERDRAGTGAEVDRDRFRDIHLAQPVDGPAGHDLGFRPGHENSGTDIELEVPEVRPPGDVLQRLAVLPAADIHPEPGVELRVRHRVQFAALDVVDVRRDDLGVGAR